MKHILYECDICGAYHPWDFSGDCRDDDNRFPDVEDYACFVGVDPDEVEVRSMTDRLEADGFSTEEETEAARKEKGE